MPHKKEHSVTREPLKLRSHILIGGQPTVELDYSAMHVHLLYSQEGQSYWDHFGDNDDPYMLEGWGGLTSFGEKERTILKLAYLIGLNASDEEEAFGAIRKSLRKESISYAGIDLKGIINAFREKHALISISMIFAVLMRHRQQPVALRPAFTSAYDGGCLGTRRLNQHNKVIDLLLCRVARY